MQFTFHKIVQKIKKPFLQGLKTSELIKAIIVSILFTVIPVFGITTISLVFMSIKFKLNLPLMIMVSYLATPLQFLLFIPFIHIGETVLNVNHTLLTVQDIKNAFDISFWNTVNQLLLEIVCGISGWMLIAFPISASSILFINKISRSNSNKNETINH